MFRFAAVLLILAPAACAAPPIVIRPSPEPISCPPADADPFRDALNRLSALARYVDAGKGRVGDVQDPRLRPGRIMTEIRKLIRERDDRSTTLLAYVRSREEPIAARMLAVLSIGQMWTTGTVTALCSILEEPADARLVAAVIRSHHMPCLRGEPDVAFDGSVSLSGLSPGYAQDATCFGRRRCLETPDGANVAPLVDALLHYLDCPVDDPTWVSALCLIERFCGRKEFTAVHRSRFKRHVEAAYLGGKPGWHVLFNHYARMAGFLWTREELTDLLGRGLPQLSPEDRVNVLDQVAGSDPDAIRRAPFQNHVEAALERVRKSTQDDPRSAWGRCLLHVTAQSTP